MLDNDAQKRADAMTLVAGLVIETVEQNHMLGTARVLLGMDLAEARQLAVAAIRLAAAMFSTEAEAWAEGDYGDPDDDELPPAASVLALFRRANRQ